MILRESKKKNVCPICGCNHLTQEDNPRDYGNFMSIPHSCNKCGAYVGDWYKPVKTVFGAMAWEYAVTMGLDVEDTPEEEVKRELEASASFACRHFIKG